MPCRLPRKLSAAARRVAALIVKADQIAQRMIAEDNAQFGLAFADLVRLIELLGIAHMTLAIAADSPASKRSSISSSVAIQRMPCWANSGIIA